MAAIKWPDGLPGPDVNSYSRQEIVGFKESQVASGPSFVEPFSADTPILHSVTYVFREGDARIFQKWLRQNKMKQFAPLFDAPVVNEIGGYSYEECRFTREGYPQLSSVAGKLYTYTAQLLTRKMEFNDDLYSDEIDAIWSVANGDIDLGSSLLDEGLNL